MLAKTVNRAGAKELPFLSPLQTLNLVEVAVFHLTDTGRLLYYLIRLAIKHLGRTALIKMSEFVMNNNSMALLM